MSKMVTLRLSDELFERLEAIAKNAGTPRATAMIYILSSYAERNSTLNKLSDEDPSFKVIDTRLESPKKSMDNLIETAIDAIKRDVNQLQSKVKNNTLSDEDFGLFKELEASLSDLKVALIRRANQLGTKQKDIALALGISGARVNQILHGN